MNLYERYIFKRVLIAAATTLGFAVLVMATIQALDHAELLIGSRTGFSLFVAMLTTLLAPAMVMLSPLAVTIGVVVAAHGANRDGETTVMSATGFSGMPGALPALAVGALTGLACLAVSLGVEPWANQTGKAILARAAADVVRLSNRPGEFRTLDERLFVRVGAQIDASRFSDVLIVDQRDPAKETIYTARALTLAEVKGRSVIALEECTIQTKAPEAEGPSIFQLSDFMLDVSNLMDNRPSTGEQPREWSTFRLAAHMAAFASSMEPLGEARAEMHRRLSDWLYPIAFAGLAMAFTSRPASGRSRQADGLFLALATGLGLRFAGFAALGKSGDSGFAALLVYLLPLGALAVAIALTLGSRAPLFAARARSAAKAMPAKGARS